MKENKLFRVLRSLNRDEFLKFVDFANSPYFNKRRDIAELVKFLSGGFPAFLQEYTDEKIIYKNVYGDREPNQQVVKNLFTRANDLLSEYLVQAGLKSDGFIRTNLLANQLAARGSQKSAESIVELEILRLDKSESYAVEYLKKLYDFLELKNDLLNFTTFSYKNKILNSKLRGESAVNYFLLALLRIANEYASYNYVQVDKEKEKLYNSFFSYFDFEKYLVRLKEIASPHYAVMAMNYYGLLSKIDERADEHREKLKKLAFENLDSLREKDKYECWVMIFAAYIFSSTPAKGDVSVELHKVNKFFVESGLMQTDESGYIYESNYHNIAMQAIAAKDFEWSRHFLETNKHRLAPGAKESSYALCMSTYFFSTQQYEKCISALSRVKSDRVMTSINVRTSYIKCYYELGYYDQAESALSALNDYLTKSRELTAQVRRPLPPFVRYVRLLVKTRSQNRKFPAEHYVRAKKLEGYNSKSWILEKIEELL